jgi:sortase (surface protein transpeptidase)
VRSGRRTSRRLVLLLAGVLLPLCACGGAVGGPAAGATSSSPTAVTPPTAPTPPAAALPAPEAAILDPADVPAPTALSIPAIGVDSSLLQLGVAADGTAEVPIRYESAGWFDGGGRPGARGPTVLLGHVDSTEGPAVFYRLRDLAPGDEVVVTVAGGGVARYAVTGTERVAKGRFPTAAVFGATTTDVLRLVTCTGDFDRAARSYTDNLVVTAARLP